MQSAINFKKCQEVKCPKEHEANHKIKDELKPKISEIKNKILEISQKIQDGKITQKQVKKIMAKYIKELKTINKKILKSTELKKLADCYTVKCQSENRLMLQDLQKLMDKSCKLKNQKACETSKHITNILKEKQIKAKSMIKLVSKFTS